MHSVDVHVSGISFEREQRAAKELDEQQKKLLGRSPRLKRQGRVSAAAAAGAARCRGRAGSGRRVETTKIDIE